MSAVSGTGIILLAAGSSSRMGRSKQLLRIGNEPLLLKSTTAAVAAGVGTIVVVLGADAREHRVVIEHLPVQIVHNEQWQNGMGGSLKVALSFLLEKNPMLNGVIVLVCDQPHLNAGHIRNLVSANSKTGKAIIASRYAGTEGVPAYFAQSIFPQLLSLNDIEGAKKVISKNRHELVSIDFPLGEVDLDTPEDYDIFKNKNPIA